jgi:hypothetical protein
MRSAHESLYVMLEPRFSINSSDPEAILAADRVSQVYRRPWAA